MNDPCRDPESSGGAPISRCTFGRRLAVGAVAGQLQGLIGSAQVPVPQGDVKSGKLEELCALSAIELAARIRRKDVSARDVMAAHLAQIERLNPKVNAIVTLVGERAMA